MRSDLASALIYLSHGVAGATLGLFYKGTRISSNHMCGVYLVWEPQKIKNSFLKIMQLGQKSRRINSLKTFFLMFSAALKRLFWNCKKDYVLDLYCSELKHVIELMLICSKSFMKFQKKNISFDVMYQLEDRSDFVSAQSKCYTHRRW